MTKSAMITLCGRANVGKSTLVNALVGEKVAIVSDKPQTTRNRITAIVNRGETQFVLMDTPGFHKPRTRLGDFMVSVDFPTLARPHRVNIADFVISISSVLPYKLPCLRGAVSSRLTQGC